MSEVEIKSVPVVKVKGRRWGEFVVNKPFEVRRGKTQNGIFGVIVQTVKKTTSVTVHEAGGDRTLTTSDEIAAFTSNQVQYATHSYSELFAILDGVCPESDNFQNGALLRYEKEKGTWYSDDEPPTSGTIRMVGSFAFVETPETFAREVQEKTDAQSGTLSFLGVDWSFDASTPANGLGYTDKEVELSNPYRHTVVVTWKATTPGTKTHGATTIESSMQRPSAGGRRRTRRHRRASRRVRA